LRAIFSETPERQSRLEQQFSGAVVLSRENSGAGFFTAIFVPHDIPPVSGPNVLGYETSAQVAGLNYGMGFVLFVEDGRLHLLEEYSYEPESTSEIQIETVQFSIFNHRADTD
jgi:hypothetical protein